MIPLKNFIKKINGKKPGPRHDLNVHGKSEKQKQAEIYWLIKQLKITFNKCSNTIINSQIINLLNNILDDTYIPVELRDFANALNTDCENASAILQFNGGDKVTSTKYSKLYNILKDTPTVLNKDNNVGILIYRSKSQGMNNDMVIYFPACEESSHYLVGGNVNTTLQGGNKKEVVPVKKYASEGWQSIYNRKRSTLLFGIDKYPDAYDGVWARRPWEALNIKKSIAKNTKMLLNAYRDGNIEVYKDDIIIFIHTK